MSDVKSKNLYELLGNDHDQDSDKEPEPPTKAIDKTQGRSGKREGPKEKTDQPPRNRDSDKRRGGFTGNERAFRDNPTGRRFNRGQPVEGEEGATRGRDSGPGAQRGGRGSRGPRRGGDRHINRSGKDEHVKQSDQAWGQPTGEGEWTDEKAGEAIAQQEVKEGGIDATDTAPVDGEGNTLADEREPEPEDTSKSYAEYLAEQAAKKLEALGLKEARAPNEGSKENKKWKSAKELTKEEGESYFIGETKAKRERDRAAKKEFVDIDYAFKEQPRDGARGRGRGPRARGGERGRGEFRGGRGGGDRGDRGERGGRGGGGDSERGEFRGGRGGGERGSYRGRGRGGDGSLSVDDQKAFPSLGGN